MRLKWDHVSLAVNDIDEAVAFFSKGLGFSVCFLERNMTDQIASMLNLRDVECDLVQMVGADGGPKLELIAFRHEDVEDSRSGPISPGMGHVAFQVEAFEDTLVQLQSLGARTIGKVTQFSDGKAVYLATPFGAFLEIEEMADPRPLGHPSGEAR